MRTFAFAVVGFTLFTVASIALPGSAGARNVGAYGGIGATVADFAAAHPDGLGKPPAGTTYYHINSTRGGRVIGYQVVIGWPARYRPYVVLRRLTGRELPPDAKVVKPYNGYCAIYRSRWLGRRVQAIAVHHRLRPDSPRGQTPPLRRPVERGERAGRPNVSRLTRRKASLPFVPRRVGPRRRPLA
jgi:hypothetical protein